MSAFFFIIPPVDYRYVKFPSAGLTERRGSGTVSTMSGSREEERRKLADIINHWNANRLDLFEISRPTEVRRAARGGRRGRGPVGPLLGELFTVKLPLGSETLEASCGGQRGWLGSLRGKPPYVRGENQCQTPLKNPAIYYVVIYTHPTK